jgi:hypothetical protein
MKLSHTKSVIAIIGALATASALSVEILGPMTSNGRRVIISTPVSIEGCDVGLRYSASKNIYWCPGFMSDPDYIAPATSTDSTGSFAEGREASGCSGNCGSVTDGSGNSVTSADGTAVGTGTSLD